MIRSVLYLHPRPGRGDDVVRLFEEERVLEEASRIAGFVSAELQVPLEGEPLLVLALWDSREAYGRWLDSPVRARIGERLSQLLAEETSAELYSVAASASAQARVDGRRAPE